MHSEAKLNLFKQTSRLRNLKILLQLSLIGIKDFSAMNYLHLNYVSRPVCGPCDLSHSLESEPQHLQNLLMQIIPNMHHDTRIAWPTWLKQHGVTIKKGAFVISGTDNFFPIFAKVIDVLLILDIVILSVPVQC